MAKSTAPRCKASGHVISVPHEDWIDGKTTAVCPTCGCKARWASRATDLPPWGRIAPHLTDGTPSR